MKNTYFKMIGQKTSNDKMILVAVVPVDFIGEVPDIFEVQCVKAAPNIYTGTYPTIKINTETLKDRTENSQGAGIAGIILREEWYNQTNETEDVLGIKL